MRLPTDCKWYAYLRYVPDLSKGKVIRGTRPHTTGTQRHRATWSHARLIVSFMCSVSEFEKYGSGK